MKNILICGGLGFLGSHLAQRLEEDNNVIIVDSLISGSEKNTKYLNKSVVYSNLKVEDLCPDYFHMKIDEIYHLASIASPPIYQKYPLETALANSLGTYKLLELAKYYNAKILYCSTSEVYGDPEENPQKEDYRGPVNTLGIRSCYDESKRFGETLCYIYSKYYNIDVKIARIFNTYGDRMLPTDGRIVTNFIHQLIKNKPLTFYGDGTQTRSFCYVDDTINGLVTLMEKGKSGEAYNIGNPEEISMLTLGNILVRLFDKNPATYPAVNKRLPNDDPRVRCPSINKMKKLGWEPKVSLGVGLIKMIKYIKDNV